MTARPKLWQWFTEERVTYWLKVLMLVVVGAYVAGGILTFLARIESITVIIIAAIFLAYVLYPLVRALNARLPLIAAVVIVYAALAAVVAAIVAFVLPGLSNDVGTLAQSYPNAVAALHAQMHEPTNGLTQRMPHWLREIISGVPDQLAVWFRVHRYDAAIGMLGVLATTMTALAAIVIVPVLSAYILLDSESLKRYFVALIPPQRRDGTLQILNELEQVIGGFIRGQLLVGASVGILITVMLLILHVPYAMLIGVAAAVLDIVPYIGAVLTFIPAVILAFASHGLANSLIVATLFVAIFELEGHLIAPNIVSKTVALSPLTVLLAILIGGELMGIVGMFVAVPVAGMLRVLALHVVPEKVSLEEAQPALTEAARESTELGESSELGDSPA